MKVSLRSSVDSIEEISLSNNYANFVQSAVLKLKLLGKDIFKDLIAANNCHIICLCCELGIGEQIDFIHYLLMMLLLNMRSGL